MDYSKKSFIELKQLTRDKGLSSTGKKIDLIDRLKEYDVKMEEDASRFKVYVKTLMGSCYTIYLEQTSTISELKNKLCEKMGCPPNKQILYSLSRHALGPDNIMYSDDSATLLSLGIHNESFFNLQIRIK